MHTKIYSKQQLLSLCGFHKLCERELLLIPTPELTQCSVSQYDLKQGLITYTRISLTLDSTICPSPPVFFPASSAWSLDVSLRSSGISEMISFCSLHPRNRKPAMIVTQYKLYEMTEPYVALFCHPNSELKMPQPPEPFSRGEPN